MYGGSKGGGAVRDARAAYGSGKRGAGAWAVELASEARAENMPGVWSWQGSGQVGDTRGVYGASKAEAQSDPHA